MLTQLIKYLPIYFTVLAELAIFLADQIYGKNGVDTLEIHRANEGAEITIYTLIFHFNSFYRVLKE